MTTTLFKDRTKYILIFFIFLISLSAHSQVAVDSSYRLPLNEKLHYRVYYRLAGIWVYAAFANFKTDTMTLEGRNVYKLYVEAFTRKKYNWVYSLEDHYTSYTDRKTFKPLKFEEYNIEKGITYHNIYNFLWDKDSINIVVSQSNKDTVKFSKKLPEFITDSYSAVHYLRLWDFSKFKVGDTLRYKTILTGRIFDQEIIYHGKEMVTDKKGNKVEAFKLEALVKNSSFFRADKGIFVWIANNKARWIIKVDAKIVVGSIFVYLDQPELVSFDRQ